MSEEEHIAGDHHYTAYVGPPSQYDFMGATQFRLLTSLGLREDHKILDFGCGSLRVGRLLIPYLHPQNYYGVEPNNYLIEDGIEANLGADLISVKRPSFSNSSDFSIPFEDVKFDFIVAQSIFSHTGLDLLKKALNGFANSLSEDGIVVATFIEGRSDFLGSEWIYPGCVSFRKSTILSLASNEGLKGRRLNWFHPRQTWYVFSKNPGNLPNFFQRIQMRGLVINDRRFSLKQKLKYYFLKTSKKNYLVSVLEKVLRKILSK